MTLRPFKLPGDLQIMAELLPPTFHYPENPDWSVHPDEFESLLDMVDGLRRFWPLIWLVQRLSPASRDAFRGLIWEESGKPVGMLIYQRRGTTGTWYISNVGVLPEHRRKRIAQRLASECLEELKLRGAKRVLLDVIEGNEPAYRLYRKLGFRDYSGSHLMSLTGAAAPNPPEILAGYRLRTRNVSNWRGRMDLEARIMPGQIAVYEPIDPGHFRKPAFLRILLPLVWLARAVTHREFDVVWTADGSVVALARSEARTRPGGFNMITARLDPDHSHLARFVLLQALHEVLSRGPGRRVEFMTPVWQPALAEAAQEIGFQTLYIMRRMGRLL